DVIGHGVVLRLRYATLFRSRGGPGDDGGAYVIDPAGIVGAVEAVDKGQSGQAVVGEGGSRHRHRGGAETGIDVLALVGGAGDGRIGVTDHGNLVTAKGGMPA